jgi:cytochrome c biogenesis protein CcmG/thiol:disulfide interchange protein DsbE
MFLFAAIGVAGAAWAAVAASVGKPAPGVTITTFDKQKVQLADLKGKVVVINLWATWCGPCKADMPMMSAVHSKLKDQGLVIYGVTTEDSLQPFQLKKLAGLLSYPLARKLTGDSYPILDGVPTSYVIDRAGVVRYAKAGAFEGREFVDVVLPLLKEPAPAG